MEENLRYRSDKKNIKGGCFGTVGIPKGDFYRFAVQITFTYTIFSPIL